ncbi:NAD(P)/FAD-dependent oxidoreductase [Pelomonas sp. BJYL3]|uniref:NAD(P)/FAD-dependent oxidoreductase n=1 Tax=Pelomonas sp. BJYL3 TaxID=2976697 RepID=UPI0022B2F1B3|nr:FAD-dependent oxidoreductase [Pelomonas sp. BJYL3]
MEVAIVGAGLTGVHAALELAAQGHAVVVFERSGSVAAESSFAQGGLCAPALSPVWGALCGTQALALQSSGLSDAGWRWAARQARGKGWTEARQTALLTLARQSLARSALLRKQLQLEHERSEGLLLLMRDEAQARKAQPLVERWQGAGLAHQWLDAEACRRLEPGLSPDTPLHGGWQLNEAEACNGRELCLLLKQAAQRLGAHFMFHTEVRALQAGRRPALTHGPAAQTGIAAAAQRQEALAASGPSTLPSPREVQTHSFDAIVLCGAQPADPLLAQLGLKPALRRVWGRTLTAPLRQLEAFPDLGPRANLVDDRHQLSLSRLGQRVRVSGGASLQAPSRGDKGFEQLHEVLHDWFPGAIQPQQAQHWQGSRLMVADGLPLLGASGAEGIWLNLAQGGQGAALAAGAAQLMAALIGGRDPGWDLSPFSAERLR